MLAPFAALGAIAEPDTPPDPPAAAPSNVTLYSYSGNRVGVQWVNGDATASTEIGTSLSPSTEPAGAEYVAPPGATRRETDYAGSIGLGGTRWFWCRHVKGGQRTAWVRSDASVEEA